MHKLVFHLSSLLLASMTIFNYGTAQETNPGSAAADEPTLKLTTRLVVLDVVVTDHAGQLRNDLIRGDFQITENGVPQTILNFEPPSSHPPFSGSLINSTKDLESRAPQSPVNILVLDEINTSYPDMQFARYALKKYLTAQPTQMQAPTMLVAVNFDKTSTTMIHDYTQNRAELLSALDHHLTHFPWNLERSESRYLTFAKSLGALEQVAESSRGHVGHKNILWVGKGFPGIDLDQPALSQKSVDALSAATQQLVNMLRDSRVTLYTIDPTIASSGSVTITDADSVLGEDDIPANPTALSPFSSQINFTGLALATGGKPFYSRNDVDREIGESVRDGVNYYTIAYRPTNESDSDVSYRKIRVGFTVPGLHASYRDGYFTGSIDTPPPNPHVSNDVAAAAYDVYAAEGNAMVYTGLTISVAPKLGASNTYLVGIPENQLAWTSEGDIESAKLMVAAAAVNNKSVILQQTAESITARRKRDSVAASDIGAIARVEITLLTVPNTYRLRFVVRCAGNGRLGTAEILIPGAVPPKNTR